MYNITELTPVQQEITEITNRYSLLGVKLSDRQSELDAIRDELRKHLEHLKTLGQFLDKVQRSLPKETVPQAKEEADKTGKVIKVQYIYILKNLFSYLQAGNNFDEMGQIIFRQIITENSRKKISREMLFLGLMKKPKELHLSLIKKKL